MNLQGRMERRKTSYGPYVDDMQYQPETQQEQYIMEQQREINQQRQQRQMELEETNAGFGDTRNPVSIAKNVENHPTPPGVCEIIIGGRPIDLHMFEDYLVWKVSPYQLRTLLRYHNARTIEEIKNYSLRPTLKLKSGTLMLVIVAILMLVGGLAIFMFMPEITAMLQGYVP